MPLKLDAPRLGKTPYYYIRGTYLGRYVNQSTKTGERSLAWKMLKSLQRDIERGAFDRSGQTGFSAAADNYAGAGGEIRTMRRLKEYFKNEPLANIDQAKIDEAASFLMPDAGSATRNREIYTPISAVLKRAGFEQKIKRPKGWRGSRLTHWLTPENAFKVFSATKKIDAPSKTKLEFRILLRTLCYTGIRLGDALGFQCSDIDLNAATAAVRKTKTGKPRLVFLPPVVVRELRLLPSGLKRDGKLFRFHKGGRLYDLLDMTCKAAGIVLPKRVAFHVFCHTWATWMRVHGGLDTFDLLKTDRWSDPASADRYAHVVISEQSRKAILLPIERKAARRK